MQRMELLIPEEALQPVRCWIFPQMIRIPYR